MFKTRFWVQNHLLNLCSSAVNSQMLLGYCVVKKLVWNVRIKDFWYTTVVINSFLQSYKDGLINDLEVIITFNKCTVKSSYKKLSFKENNF